MIMGSLGRHVVETAHDHDVAPLARFCARCGLAVEISRTATATGVKDQTFENPKTGAVLETAFAYPDGIKGTDLYLSVTSRDTVPPNPYRR